MGYTKKGKIIDVISEYNGSKLLIVIEINKKFQLKYNAYQQVLDYTGKKRLSPKLWGQICDHIGKDVTVNFDGSNEPFLEVNQIVDK